MSIQYNNDGIVFDIQRFSVHDGPGIRTTVFLKGCPLSCAWCHNPESWCKKPELNYVSASCIGCGRCVSACASGAHTIGESGHFLYREKCIGCFACAEACPTDALSVIGRRMSVSEVMKTVKRDRPFYKSTGGVTISGGEPFYQSEFLLGILQSAKDEGISVCIETSGAARAEDIKRAMPYVDMFLFDIKLTPGDEHKKYIGIDGEIIYSNLDMIDREGGRIALRCPIIPGVNDNTAHFEFIRDVCLSHSGVVEINIEPYHDIGLSKNDSIGRASVFAVPGLDMVEFKKRITDTLMPILTESLTVKITI